MYYSEPDLIHLNHGDQIASFDTLTWPSMVHAECACQYTQSLDDAQADVIKLPLTLSAAGGRDRAPDDTPHKVDIPISKTFVPEDRLKFVGLCGAQIVRDVLIRNGVQHAFAYSGGANIHLTDSICTDGRIKVFLPRHEQGAGHMAEGYARVTGRPGVVSVTSGPGATNVITPLQDAMSDGIPAYVDEAFRVATSGRPGPVLLSIPRDVFEATWRDDHPIVRNITLPSYPAQIRPPPPRASEPPAPKIFGDISEAATRINNSKRPLIIAGAGLLSSPDGPRILSELAFRGNIPVATTLHGLGAFDEDHHLSLHMLGLHGSVYGNYAAQSADTIIVLGARLDERVTANIDGFAVAARADFGGWRCDRESEDTRAPH